MCVHWAGVLKDSPIKEVEKCRETGSQGIYSHENFVWEQKRPLNLNAEKLELENWCCSGCFLKLLCSLFVNIWICAVKTGLINIRSV